MVFSASADTCPGLFSADGMCKLHQSRTPVGPDSGAGRRIRFARGEELDENALFLAPAESAHDRGFIRNAFQEHWDLDDGLISLTLGSCAALLVGFSKTAIPGAAIPAVALMAEAFRDDTKLSVGAMLPILLVGDLFALAYYRRNAQWERLVELFPYVLVGMIPGYVVLRTTSGPHLRILLGTLILLLLVIQLLRQRFHWQPRLDRRWMVGLTGLLAGFGTTVGNAAGPVMSIYLVGQRLDKQEFLGTSAWFFFLVNLSKVPFFYGLNMITRQTLQFDLLLLPVVVGGALAGAWLLRHIPQRLFNTLVLLLAGIAAVRLLIA